MSNPDADPWRIDQGAAPSRDDLSDMARFLVRYGVLAPSGHNTQPWLFRAGDGAIEVHADRTRGLPVVDPDDRELTISCGAAIANIEVAARHFGLTATVDPLPARTEEDMLARIALAPGEAAEPAEEALFEAIPKRRTNRAAYEATPVPDGLVGRCRDIASAHGVELAITTDPEVKQAVGRLVAEGDRAQFADRRFRRELASWVNSRRLGSRDGMSGSGFGMPDVLSPVGALVIRTFDLGNSVAAGDEKKIAEGSPCLGAFVTDGDHPEAWLETGRALGKVLLALTANGFTGSYLNQPVEVEALRPKLRQAMGLSGQPQLLMRFGQGPDIAPAARRPAEEVILA